MPKTSKKYDFNDYQKIAKSTAIFGEVPNITVTHTNDTGNTYYYDIPIYPILELAAESGELLNKLKKVLRDGSQSVDRDSVVDELGDCLWAISSISGYLGVSLEQIAKRNNEKLRSRQTRGRIGGSGDTR